jgi:outer membrane receptor protein involved in Fe transport
VSIHQPQRGINLVRASVAAVLSTASIMAYTPQVFAADEPAADTELEEVQVTGSRIVRRDTESNSPLVTVDSAALESKAGLNIESYLNQLPNFNPAASPTVKGGSGGNTDVQISAVNSVGIASISLRGFGPNRSLALIDGRRAVPTNALMVVDINGIPSSMIQSVEIISGGASATYGADAIGGVSNFKLRRDFQGLEVDTQYGITEEGDGEEMRASAIMGTKFADNRGNIVFGAEYYDRKAAYEKNRDFFTDSWSDPSVGGNFLGFVFGANAYNTLTNAPSADAFNAILAGRPAGTNSFSFGSAGTNQVLRFNPDTSIFQAAGNNANSWRGRPLDGRAFSLVNAYDNSLCSNPNAATCAAGPRTIQQIKYNETEGYVSSPQTRYAFMASGKYDLTDKIQFFSSARFAQSTTETLLAGTNATGGWSVFVPYNATTDSPVDPNPALYATQASIAAVLANPGAFANPNFRAHGTAGALHPVPVQQAILLNSRPANVNYCLTGSAGCLPVNATTDLNLVGTARTGRGAPWAMETYPLDSFGRRATNNTATTFQVETGLTFELPVKDWTGELYYSRGESQTYNVAYGNNSLARWRQEVMAPDYGYRSNLQSNLTNNLPSPSPGFGSVAVPCTSGFYDTIFRGDAVPSADCQYAVSAPLQTRTQNQQDIFEANFQGGVFTLPAGEVRAAVGYQQRRNAAQFNPDILQSTASFTDQVIGVYPTGYLRAQSTAKDVYAELLIPVLTDSFVRKVELELGGRASNYDVTKDSTTFKINGNIEVNESLRFRGGFNRATRSPNLGELYLPLQQIFTGNGVFGDPCGVNSNSPFGAGGAIAQPFPGGAPALLASGQTAAGANSTYLICQAQMGAVASSVFYGSTQAQPGAGGGGFAWVNQTGNAALDSEVADTWTAGVVLVSPFDNPLLRGLTATVDWYKITIDKAILPYSIDYARYLCYGAVQVTTAAAAQAQAQSAACQNNPRNLATGGSVTTQVSYDNQARVKTSGVDFTVNWRASMEDLGLGSIPGGIGLSVQGTYLDTYQTKQSPASFDPLIDWKGSLGPNLQGFNAGAYDYRLFTSLSYNLPSVSFSFRWRHLPEAVIAAKAQENAIIKNNAAVAAGGAGTRLSYTPTPALSVPQYDVFDLSGFWTISDVLSMRFGIDNVFDTAPSSNTRSAGRPYDNSLTPAQNAANLAAVCAGAPGCQNPTAYSFANSGAGGTAGGYYDVLGRRYYIGLKARF